MDTVTEILGAEVQRHDTVGNIVICFLLFARQKFFLQFLFPLQRTDAGFWSFTAERSCTVTCRKP